MGRIINVIKTAVAVLVVCACAGPLFAQSVPYGAQRAIVRHFTQSAVLSVWLFDGRVHAYFDLFDDRFFVSPAGWRAGESRATAIACDDGSDGTGEFTENAHFIIEFPPEADLTTVRVNYDREVEFHLIPLTEAEMSALSPETEEAVRAIAHDEILRAVQVHGVHLRRYFDLDTFDTFGLPVWFYAAENLVTPEQLEEMYPGRFRPEDSEGILWDRNLKPW